MVNTVSRSLFVLLAVLFSFSFVSSFSGSSGSSGDFFVSDLFGVGNSSSFSGYFLLDDFSSSAFGSSSSSSGSVNYLSDQYDVPFLVNVSLSSPVVAGLNAFVSYDVVPSHADVLVKWYLNNSLIDFVSRSFSDAQVAQLITTYVAFSFNLNETTFVTSVAVGGGMNHHYAWIVPSHCSTIVSCDSVALASLYHGFNYAGPHYFNVLLDPGTYFVVFRDSIGGSEARIGRTSSASNPNSVLYASSESGSWVIQNTRDVSFYEIRGAVIGDSIVTPNYPGSVLKAELIPSTSVQGESVNVSDTILQGLVVESLVCDSLTYPNEENLPSVAKLSFNFTVVDQVELFVNTSVVPNISLGSSFLSTNCVVNGSGSVRDYVCNASVNFYDLHGSYDLVVNASNSLSVVSESTSCSVGQLLAYRKLSSTLGFAGAGPGISNVQSGSPLSVKNTGNVPLSLFITGFDLDGVSQPSQRLAASSFKAGLSLGSSVGLADSVQKDVEVTVSVGNSSVANVYLWLSMPSNAVVQDYRTGTSWILEATS
jgi:hypothetical protein